MASRNAFTSGVKLRNPRWLTLAVALVLTACKFPHPPPVPGPVQPPSPPNTEQR